MDFQYSDQPEPHKERTKQILKAHPEVRNLIGRNPASAVITIFVVALQFVIAYLLADQAWWLTIIVAFFIGAFADHNLFVLIHEASHNLIFKNRTLNTIFGIIADLPKVVPSYVSFKSYHLKHHSFQGDYYLDADLASKWEASLIGNTFFGKMMWELFFPFFQAFRTMRLKEIEFMNWWVIINWIVVFAVDAVNNYLLWMDCISISGFLAYLFNRTSSAWCKMDSGTFSCCSSAGNLQLLWSFKYSIVECWLPQ